MAETEPNTNAPEFIHLTPSDVRGAMVLPQALDNQWAPREVLCKARDSGSSLASLNSVKTRRVEYLRALVGARRVIVNRAYMYNSPAVSRADTTWARAMATR